MKVLITYYSYTGHADKVAKMIAGIAKRDGEVDIQRLKPKDELKTFLGQSRAAFMRRKAALEGAVKYDASGYDTVFIGSPVWAFAPTPAVNTYLEGIEGVGGKRAVIFLTSGSGAGVNRCFRLIRNILAAKGARGIAEINIPDRKLDDEEFVVSAIERAIKSAGA